MAESANSPARNVALDNLRVVAMLLGLVTHGVLPYAATGIVGFPIRDRTRHVLADACYFAVHDFRMQLFFLLAGFAATALGTRRGVRAVVRNRLARVALPLALAVLVICPAMHLLFAHHAAGRGAGWDAADSGGWVGPNFHLWFLYYLLMVAAPLVALLALGHRVPARVVRAFDLRVRWVLASPWKVPVAALVAIPVLWNMPAWWIDTPKGWRPNLPIYAYYLGFFLTGALLYRHQDLLAGVGRRWMLYFAVANLFVLPAMVRLTVTGNWAEVEGNTPPWFAWWKAGAIFLGGLYTWMMVAALVGLFQKHFAGGGRWWKYLADASYWCYLAGFPVQAAFQVWLAAYRIPILPEFVLVNVLTFAVLLASYELCVRHTWVGLMLNGKRPERTPKPVADAAPPVVIATRVAVPERPVCGRGEERPASERAPRATADAA
jgi:peptidoglycan/LPS O-acetylase OafA/YrhL